MSVYTRHEIINCIDKKSISTIIELGSREGNDSVELSKYFPSAKILSFEANPGMKDTCLNNFKNVNNIQFFPVAAGSEEKHVEFHPYVLDNVGASSLFKRIDYNSSQITLENKIICRRIDNILKENNIDSVDYLCADIQGYEVEALIGLGHYLNKCKYIVLEVPINESVYLNAPNNKQVLDFMESNNFLVKDIFYENQLESNYFFINKNFI